MRKDIINIIFGDSISYGLYDNESYGWINRFKRGNVFYFNMSIPGQDSNKILERFDTETKNRYSETDTINIIFSFGINDSLLLKEDDNYKYKFEDNIDELVRLAKQYTNNIYFLGLPFIDLKIRDKYSFESINTIESIIKEKCMDNNISFISIKEVLNEKDLVDGLHPNEIGHQKLADYLYLNLFKDIDKN